MSSLALLQLLVMLAAPAEGPADEASRRFDLAVRRYNRGDREGALAEFQRVQELAPRPAVLFNVAMIHAALGHWVQAHQGLTEVLAAPGTLPEPRLARAREKLAEVESKVGRLTVRCATAGATVEVNGVSAGVAPLPGPVVVPAGRALVTVSAPGRVPQRAERLVPGGGAAEVTLELEPQAVAVSTAQLAVRCAVPGADVFVDDVRVAVTPLATTLAVAAGSHRVRLEREGYVPVARDVTLAGGASGQLQLDLEPDTGRKVADDGALAPVCTETQVQLTVDGTRRGVDLASLTVPPGPHVVLLERGGFYPVRRDVTVQPGATLQLPVMFEPTPELRATMDEQFRRHRLASVTMLIAGAVGLIGGGGFLTYGLTRSATVARELDAAELALRTDLSCASTAGLMRCEARKDAAAAERDRLSNTLWLGPTAMGLGAALVAAAAVVLFTAPDVSRFDLPAPDDVLTPALGLTVGPDGAGLTVTSRF